MEREDLSEEIVRMLCAPAGPVAVTGIGGAGKSTLAARACADPRVRRKYPDGIGWLETKPGQDPVALLAALATQLRLSDTAKAFTTVAQGRDQLAVALRGKRVLIALDNVWDRRLLDAVIGLTPNLLFTTRLRELVVTVKAAPVQVDKLTQEQALSLMSQWTGQARATLPDTATALCAKVGNLALGVAMTGAMVAQGQLFTDVLTLIDQDIEKVEADLDPAYQYETLSAAIEAGIDDLPKADQRRYIQLAVFADRGPFSREAAEELWQPALPAAEVGRLFAELTGRSLLTAAGQGWYAAHDLQYDVLKRRLRPASLAAAHVHLLQGYRARYGGRWAASAADPYLARALAGHLRDANLIDELRAVLADTEWIQARLAHGQLPELIADYGYSDDTLSRQILRALRLSAPAVTAEPAQLRGQLAGRLMDHPDPAVASWARNLIRDGGSGLPGLVPVTPALTSVTDLLELAPLTGDAEQVWSVAVTPDGSRAVSGGKDGSVRVWDLTVGREQARLCGHKSDVNAVAVTADGSRAVSGGNDKSVRVWDLTAGRQQAKLTGHRNWVTSVAVTPDGTKAVSGSMDGRLRVWDLATGRRQARLSHGKWVRSVAITADGTKAVSCGDDGSVRVWDLAAARELANLTGHEGRVLSVAITADATRAVSCGNDGSVRVWDLIAGCQQAKLTVDTGSLMAIAVTADGTRAVTGSNDGSVRVWDLAAGCELDRLTGHGDRVRSVDVTVDGTTAVSGSLDGSVRVWDLTTAGSAVRSGHTGRAWSVAVTADGARAVSGGQDTSVRVWDLVANRELAALAGHDREVFSVAVTADGARAVSGGRDKSVRVWDLAAGRELAALAGHSNWVLSVAVTADGTRAVSGGQDTSVRVWDLVANRELAALAGHSSRVLSVAVSADGAKAVSGSQDGTVRVWDLAGDRELAPLMGHTGPVWSLALTADGSTAISGGADGSVRAWDVGTGRELAALTGAGQPVWSVAVTADGSTAVSGSADGLVRVWDLATGAQVATWYGDHPIVGCTALGRRPLHIGIGERLGRPYLLELRGQDTAGSAGAEIRHREDAVKPAGIRYEFKCPFCKGRIYPGALDLFCPRCVKQLPVGLIEAMQKTARTPQPKPLQPNYVNEL